MKEEQEMLECLGLRLREVIPLPAAVPPRIATLLCCLQMRERDRSKDAQGERRG